MPHSQDSHEGRRMHGRLNLSRRQLLGGALSCAATTLFPGQRLQAEPNPSAPRRHLKVAVVGAGLAGLIAAYELIHSGHEVMVFEARSRPGGRIWTLRDSFDDGLYVEAGAYDFGDAYPLLRGYITAFGLEMEENEPSPKQNNAVVYQIRERRYVVEATKEPEWPYTLSNDERKLGLYGLWDKYTGKLRHELTDPLGAGWPNPKLRWLDELTVDQVLERRGASSEVRSLLHQIFLGQDFDHVSAMQELTWQMFIDRNHKWTSLRGGNDRLPYAFAERLGSRLNHDAELRAIAQTADSVRLSISRKGMMEEVAADRAVLAIPYSILRQLEIDGSLSSQKRDIIANLRYESATRGYLQSRRRFWVEEGLRGFASTDLDIGYMLDFTAGQRGERGILATECTGAASRRLDAMPAERRVRSVLDQAVKVFPGLEQNFERGKVICWAEEPWSRGAWAYCGPGEMTRTFPQVATPEGRVHFAGEHTASVYVMEGAAQSGVRCAEEINKLA